MKPLDHPDKIADFERILERFFSLHPNVSYSQLASLDDEGGEPSCSYSAVENLAGSRGKVLVAVDIPPFGSSS